MKIETFKPKSLATQVVYRRYAGGYKQPLKYRIINFFRSLLSR